MPQTSVPDPIRLQCRHIHADGRRCGSPSVRTRNFCYYHGKARHAGPRQPQVKTLTDRKASTFDLPSPADLADRAGIQLAIAQILHKIAHNEIDSRRAGLLLYGLQIASMNAREEGDIRKKARREALVEPVEELTEDPVHGPVAPEAEYSEYQGPKSSVERLLEELQALDQKPVAAPHPGAPFSTSPVGDPSSPPLILHAVAALPNLGPGIFRSGPKFPFSRTLQRNRGEGYTIPRRSASLLGYS